MLFIQRVAAFICFSFLLASTAHAARNVAPTITGTPATSAKVNVWYVFAPTAKDANFDKLGFTISNKPAWMSFSTVSGSLWGTPGSGAVGTYNNIVISVSDGRATTSLPAFSIKVVANSGNSSASSSSSSAAAPPTPTGLTANAGNAQVNLRWSTSAGATGYKVKRSLRNGGPYTQFGAPTSAAYTDSSVTNDTPYYYVVSASNAAGTSADSAQVTAVPNVSPLPATSAGTWVNVTPAGVNLTGNLSCGNYGASTIQADPARPSNLYTQFNCQGIWKSTDYGATWTGPINKGTNGTTVGDCAGGITIAPNSTASAPTIYQACIRGAGTGFWKSVDGGVNWTRYTVAPSGASRQDYYPPVVNPYDQNHLLMAGHEMNYLVQSVDGGRTWTNVPVASGMAQNGGTASIFFINTGNASSTRGTWLWMAQQTGGGVGTWRTTNSGASWVQVDKNEHPHGASQIYQPDNKGVVYMAGAYSSLGWGVLRSTNFGQTWTHVGMSSNETVVVGTTKNVYAMFGYPVGPGGATDAAFESSPQPGTSTWIAPGTPANLTQGAAQIAVVNDGARNVLVGAMWNSGLWRYIEP